MQLVTNQTLAVASTFMQSCLNMQLKSIISHVLYSYARARILVSSCATYLAKQLAILLQKS